jgi:hypothetical protein
MYDNPYKSPDAPAANGRKPMAGQTTTIGPRQTGIWGLAVVFLMYALLPFFSKVFLVGDESPLDRLRIPHPATIGYLCYFAVCFLAAVCYGLAVGLSHKAVLRLLRDRRGKHVTGWVFLCVAIVGGYSMAMCTYRHPRVSPDRSPHLTSPAAGRDTDTVVDQNLTKRSSIRSPNGRRTSDDRIERSYEQKAELDVAREAALRAEVKWTVHGPAPVNSVVLCQDD